MLKCLYIAGTLFISDGDKMAPIGPNSIVSVRGDSIWVSMPRLSRDFEGYPEGVPVGEFITECERQATADVMEGIGDG